MDWLSTITRTFFDFGAMAEVLPQLLGVGLLNTLIISIAATIIGVALGMVVAVMGISPSGGFGSRPGSTRTSSADSRPS